MIHSCLQENRLNPILTTFSTVPFSQVPFPTVTVDGGHVYDPEGYARKAWAFYNYSFADVKPFRELAEQQGKYFEDGELDTCISD